MLSVNGKKVAKVQCFILRFEEPQNPKTPKPRVLNWQLNSSTSLQFILLQMKMIMFANIPLSKIITQMSKTYSRPKWNSS